MHTPQQAFTQSIIDLLQKYADDKRKEGLIPTIELLIEELEGTLKKD